MSTQTAPIPTIVPITGKDQAILQRTNYADNEVTRVVDAAFKAAKVQPITAPNGQPARGGWWEYSADMRAVIVHPWPQDNTAPAPAADTPLFQPGQQVRRTLATASGPVGEEGTIICLFNPAGPPRYNVKWASGGTTVGVEQHGLADNTPAPAAKLAVVALAILKGDSREIEICLNNGQRVKVYGSNGGYIQYGANELGTAKSWDAYQLTQPIAQRWAKWLNTGKGAPKPSTRYTEYQSLNLYEQATAQY